MKKIFITFGLIALVAVVAMCSTPGSNQQSTNTETSNQVLANEKGNMDSLGYWWQKLPVAKGSKIKITFESTDNNNLDFYILNNQQHNLFYVYGTDNLKQPSSYMKFYSGRKTEFQYTFPEDGLYYLIFNNTLTAPREFYYTVTLVSGEILEEYDYVICEGYNVTIKKPEINVPSYVEYYRYCITYLEEGEVVNIYFSVKQNEYKNLFVKLYVLDDKGYVSWAKSPYDYVGKIFFDKVNESERSYEQVSWTVPKTGYYYFVFWNQNSPDNLKFDFKVYKD
jgi:hypothetical protein